MRVVAANRVPSAPPRTSGSDFGIGQVTTFADSEWLVAMEVAGSRVYLLNEEKMHVVDVSDSFDPVYEGTYESNADDMLAGISAVEGVVHLSTQHHDWPELGGSLQVLDAGEPDGLGLLFEVPTACGGNLAVHSDTAVLSCQGIRLLDVSGCL